MECPHNTIAGDDPDRSLITIQHWELAVIVVDHQLQDMVEHYIGRGRDQLWLGLEDVANSCGHRNYAPE